MSRLIEVTRPRCAAYQAVRFLDGPKLLFTSTRRGVVSVWELVVGTDDVERAVRYRDPSDHAHAIDRVVRAGCDVIKLTSDLVDRAKAVRK